LRHRPQTRRGIQSSSLAYRRTKEERFRHLHSIASSTESKMVTTEAIAFNISQFIEVGTLVSFWGIKVHLEVQWNATIGN